MIYYNAKYLLLFILLIFWPQVKAEDYFDFDEEILNHIIGNVKLRKCSCGVNEVLTRGICIPVDYTSVPLVLFSDVVEPILVNTSTFSVKEKSGLKCGFGKYVTRIEPMHDFFVLATGELLHVTSNTSYSPFEFCLDHILTENDELTWEVQLCIQKLNVPICCPFKKNNDGFCKNPYISIGFGGSVLKETVINARLVNDIQCSLKEKQIMTELSDPKNLTTAVFMNFNGESTQLVHLSSDHNEPPLHFNEDQYCLIPKIINKKVLYEASYCERDLITERFENAFQEHQILCENFSCVRKCCPDDSIYSNVARGCVAYNETFLWTPNFKRQNDSTDIEAPENLKMTYGFPICKKAFYLIDPNNPKDKYILINNGEMYVSNWKKSVSSPLYCMDNFMDIDNNLSQKALTCFPEEGKKSRCEKIKDAVLPYFLIFSCLFLLVTLVVYAWIPELHAKLHGKSLLSHVTSLFVAYLSLAIVQLTSITMPMIMCRIFGCLIQITFLGSFFWLNVMCFDIWWTLRSMRPVAETSERTRKRFIAYSMYAWGCPIIIGAVSCGLEFGLNPENFPNLIVPGFGRTSCWFQDGFALWIYFYGFVTILTAFNIFFFACVAIILLKAQKANKGILRTTSKQHQERVSIYLKLFVVMGVTWICEVVSWQEGSCELWLMSDAINALQGVFIFVIFICKGNIYKKLCKSGKDSTKRLRRIVQGSSSYGSNSQVTQQTSLDSTRKLSSSLHYHLSKLNRIYTIDEDNRK